MKRRAPWIVFALSALMLTAVVLSFAYKRQRLPFDGLAAANSGHWHAFGGLWSVQAGTIVNRSDEPGAKLLSGSPDWRDVRLDADLRTSRRRGEAGLIVRANHMGVGINAYDGYYAGYRSMDNSLVLGHSDRDWMEKQPIPLRRRPQASEWMHLELIAVGCDIAAVLRLNNTGETVQSLMHEPNCVPAGMVGLRSVGTGATWRNIYAQAADGKMLAQIRQAVPSVGQAVYPKREDDFTRMLTQQAGASNETVLDYLNDGDSPSEMRALAAAQPIASMETSSVSESKTVTLQGAVTHIEPLYVQDDSAGIEVRGLPTTALNLGDEVELTGQPVHRHGDVYFQASGLRLLWDDASTHPVAASPGQVASGSFDGALVELDGVLQSSTHLPDHRVRLLMRAGSEEFTVTVEPGLAQSSTAEWENGSTLRIRGVCSAEHNDLPAAASFALLPNSVADVQLVSGPPWNSGWRLALVSGLALLLLSAFAIIFLRAERWKMKTLYEERERLASDMHDTLAQGFAGVGYQLQSLRRGLRENADVPPNLMRRLDTACQLATETHREASTRITALHLSTEEEFDLLAVLERTTSLMLGREGLLEIRKTEVGSPRKYSLVTRDALFRIGHESVANVLRHSRATAIDLRLIYGESDVALEVQDDGQGFDVATSHGFGIGSMRTRAEEGHGTLAIRSAPGAGTTLCARLPYRHNEQAWRSLRTSIVRVLQRRRQVSTGPQV